MMSDAGLSPLFQAFHRIASTFIAKLAIVMACEKLFKGISFRRFARVRWRRSRHSTFRENRYRGIGDCVAAGSVVSAVATQVYKNVLKASGEKIQQAVPFPSSSETVSNERAADETQVLGSSEQDDETRIIGSSPVTSDATMVLSADTVALRRPVHRVSFPPDRKMRMRLVRSAILPGAGETSRFPERTAWRQRCWRSYR